MHSTVHMPWGPTGHMCVQQCSRKHAAPPPGALLPRHDIQRAEVVGAERRRLLCTLLVRLVHVPPQLHQQGRAEEPPAFSCGGRARTLPGACKQARGGRQTAAATGQQLPVGQAARTCCLASRSRTPRSSVCCRSSAVRCWMANRRASSSDTRCCDSRSPSARCRSCRSRRRCSSWRQQAATGAP